MEPILNPRRHIVLFIPYRKAPEGNLFFLQMRDGNAPTNPNIFSCFGGGVEDDESLEEAVLREVKEELAYIPGDIKYFMHSVTGARTSEVFVEEVGPDFESKITVQEGEYGKFISFDEILKADNISFIAKTITSELNAWLIGKKL